ncbi:MAG: response regulator [Methanoculleaceae archaeon]
MEESVELTIMIVDDNEAIVELFTLVLERAGYNVITANSGTEALACLQNARPDLIILDVMMTEMDGWETLTSIRKSQHHKDTPVIMLTGRVPAPDEIRKYGQQIEGYILKPIGPRELREKIDLYWEIERFCREEARLVETEEKAREYCLLCRRALAFEQLINDVSEIYRFEEMGSPPEFTGVSDQIRDRSRQLTAIREKWRERFQRSHDVPSRGT